ncbi:MAG: hypothetical protein JJ971_10095 [Balneolaceae bacterium]|nr:hypothetical protein [Balneolaceae bacterium]MBO6546404.1 hypothetical protein [Balneolaceae bacterium]MBO6648763.1 hypothetical protein [Balneolaceae bacterium]
MSITINFVQLERKKRKNGDIPIYIRLTENRRSKYLSTGITINPKYWHNY